MRKIILGVVIFMLLVGGLYQVNKVLFKDINVEEEAAMEKPKDDKPVSNQGEEDKESEPEVGIRKGHIAADFTLPNLDNKSESLWDYRGKKIILNFWSADCPPCREEMPDLNDYYLEHKDDNVVVLGVNLGQSPEVVEGFIDQNGYEFPILVDPNNSVAYAYGVVYLPTTYFIDEEGIIQDIHIGMLTKEDLENYTK
ncbi:peroxiredoxin family protein [Alkaliphilus hydrothermalis]|uniref:Peroxiredoxin n=1 Tax=Alkaliphilus hydrothermalis TaxID=1482730 RepID=A0ABS2NT82_9FIRM|nr:TlpA disulfide reductase family protein [Alkaliphilus hydrothermalis]MBM7616077.1 peroxiredoxin [Alkaliphilus hydrothermalis]